ncbi:SH3 domain and tetratricopeptide repeat-containing protein 1 [Bienertia sinuspersici]
MSSISQNPDPKSHENQTQDPKTTENQNQETTNQPINLDVKGKINDEEKEKVAEEEEKGEFRFCWFIKGGGCKDTFVAWKLCAEESNKNEEDSVEKCFEVTANLKKCMEAHSDYYEPILRAEKTAE